MARNSTTFPPGNGPGYGGPKKSAGKAPGSAGSGRKKGVKLTETKAARTREALEAALPIAMKTVIAIAGDTSDQRSLNAAFGILNRTGFHEKSGVELTGQGGGPMVIRRIIVDPKEA